ncbi:MAG: RIP metalloprotease RseP [Bacteroidales bacterium]
MDIIIRIIQVILALSLLVVIHEFGHFLFAKLFKIRVEKFYLFFPPAIVKYKSKHSDTEWGIGCIPLGGFCKISGMVDESLDKEGINHAPKPWEFRSKPAWQRLLVLFGGVLFNFILAIILYTAILQTWGTEVLPNENAIYGIETNDLSYEMGFRDGDKIISFNDNIYPKNFSDLQLDLIRNQATKATVIRNNDTINLNLDPVYLPACLNNAGMFMLSAPIIVAEIPDTSINVNSGLLANDRFVQLGTYSTPRFRAIQKALNHYKSETISTIFLRQQDSISINLKVNADSKIELVLQSDIKDFVIDKESYGLFDGLAAGANRTWEQISNYIKELGLIFSPQTKAYKSVGSFIAIGSIFPKAWDWRIFWNITAMLSVMLGVLNLVPIPGLDGGHIIFTLYEMITRRKPSDKFLIVAQIIGMILLFALIFLAFGNDIGRLIN